MHLALHNNDLKLTSMDLTAMYNAVNGLLYSNMERPASAPVDV